MKMQHQIETALRHSGLNRLSLSKRLRVSASTVGRWLRPGADLSLQILEDLARTTGSSLLTLLYRPDHHRDLLSGGTPFQGDRLPPWAQAHADAGLSRLLATAHPLETLTLPDMRLPGHHASTVHGWTLGRDDPQHHPTRRNPDRQDHHALFWAVAHSGERTDLQNLQDRLAQGEREFPCPLSLLYENGAVAGWKRLPPGTHAMRPPPHLTPAGRLVYDPHLRRPMQVSSLSTSGQLILEHPAEHQARRTGAAAPAQPWLCIDASQGDPLAETAAFLDRLDRERAALRLVLPEPTTLGDVLRADLLSHGDLAHFCRLQDPHAQVAVVFCGRRTAVQHTGWFAQTVAHDVPLLRLTVYGGPTPSTPEQGTPIIFDHAAWVRLQGTSRDLNAAQDPTYLIGAPAAELTHLLKSGRGTQALRQIPLTPLHTGTPPGAPR